MKIEDAFSSIEDLLLYNFFQYRKTQDMNWFIEGYNGRQKKLNNELLTPIKDKMMGDYYDATNDKSLAELVQKYAKIQKLETTYVTVTTLLDRFFKGFGSEMVHQEMRLKYIEEFKANRFTIPIIGTPEEDFAHCEAIYSKLQGYKTQIKIIADSIPKDEKKQATSLEKQLLIVGLSLGLSYRINPKETTVMEWIELVKLMEEKSKQN